MPIRDVAVMDDFLDLMLGSETWELALFDGDPMTDGVELSGSGYGRVTIAPADWAAAVDGAKSLTVPATLPAPTDAWDDASHWALFRVSDDAMGPTAELTEALEVTGPGDGPTIQPTVFFDDAVVAAT